MAAVHGRNTQIVRNHFDLSTIFNSANIEIGVDTAESSTFRSGGWKTFEVGLNGGSASLGGLYGASDLAELLATLQGEPGDILTIAPQGLDVVGNLAQLIVAKTTKVTPSSPVGGLVAIGYDVTAEGVVGLGASIHPLEAETATGNDPSVDNAAQTLTGAIAHLHVTAVSGTGGPTLTVRIQDSANNSTWATIGTFTVATTVTEQRLVIPGTVRRFTHADWTITGTTPSFTFAAAIART